MSALLLSSVKAKEKGKNHHRAEIFLRDFLFDNFIAFNFSFAFFLASLLVVTGFVIAFFFLRDHHTKPPSTFLILKRGRFL